MLKVAARIIDIYDDESGEIARRLPEEFHAIKVAEQDEVDALPDRAFALVMKTAGGVLRRRLPVHSADSIKLSQAYFDQVKADLHPELVKVAEKKLANPTSPEVAYIDVTKLQPHQPKVAYVEQHWGLTVDGHNCFPLHDMSLVKTAVARFPFTVNDLYPEERFLYARNICKRASVLTVSIPSSSPINLYSNDILNIGALKTAIEQRKMAVGATIGTEVLDQLALASGCRLDRGPIETDDSFELRQAKQASIRPLTADRIIGVLEQFDKLASLGSFHYLRGMLDPFAACYKKADAEGSNLFVDGVDLSKLDPKMLSDKFDESFIQSFSENPVQVYKSLPDPVKSVIREVAEAGMNKTTAEGAAYTNPHPVVGSGGDPTERLNPTTVNGLFN